MCRDCGHQASVTAGTIFQGTHMPLVPWFRAIWWVVSQKNGASALGLQRVLGLGSYRTAWTWLHKLRRAMVRPGRDRLSEMVEVDETLVGGVEPGGWAPTSWQEGAAGHCCRGARPGHWPNPNAAGSGFLGRELPAIRAASCPAWHGSDHRWVPELPRPAQSRLSPRPKNPPWQRRVGRRCTASRAPCRLASQTLAPGHSPGRSQS